ncbi:MAG: hypothetical protein ACFFAK_14320 [Promethearchaeota archaeon]
METITESKKLFVFLFFIFILFLMLIVVGVSIFVSSSMEILISFLITSAFSFGLILLACYLNYVIKTYQPSKKRIFQITEDGITIDVPYKDFFQVSWSDIEKVKVRKEYSGFVKPRKLHYILIFIGSKVYRTYSMLKGWDFRSSTIKKILRVLDTYSQNLGIEFIKEF